MTAAKKRKTIYILHVPGGGVLGEYPGAMLTRLEELTETPAHVLFQVMDGASAGAIIIAGMNVPGRTAAQNQVSFQQEATNFFPPKPHRALKMATANLLHLVREKIKQKRYDLVRREIECLCNTLAERLPWQKTMFESIIKAAGQQWVSHAGKSQALATCAVLWSVYKYSRSDDIKESLLRLRHMVTLRSSQGHLGVLFSRSAVAGIDMVHARLDHRYSMDVPRDTFRAAFGERRLGDCLTSIYIPAYDFTMKKAFYFFNRRSDFFNLAANAPSVTSRHNDRLYDAVCASMANTYAFAPYSIAKDRVYIDKAILHTPHFCVRDVLRHKPRDADVKLVIFGTGDQTYDKSLSDYMEAGIVGNLIDGTLISDVEHYIRSDAFHMIEQAIGPGNIIEFQPRTAILMPEEIETRHSGDILDARPENIALVRKSAQDFVRDQDGPLRKLALELMHNAWVCGHITNEKLARVTAKINNTPQHAAPPPPAATCCILSRHAVSEPVLCTPTAP